MSHANARLTPAGRLLLVQRIEAGTTQVELARQTGLYTGTVACRRCHPPNRDTHAGSREVVCV